MYKTQRPAHSTFINKKERIIFPRTLYSMSQTPSDTSHCYSPLFRAQTARSTKGFLYVLANFSSNKLSFFLISNEGIFSFFRQNQTKIEWLVWDITEFLRMETYSPFLILCSLTLLALPFWPGSLQIK